MSRTSPSEPLQRRLFDILPFRKRTPPARTRAAFAGRLEVLPAVRSRFLETPRDVAVYLPPGYDEDPRRRYPVVYLQDGQNLFDPATAFLFGKDWRLGETLERGAARGEIEPLIAVGVYNTGASRIDEYAPTHDAARKLGGKAPLYAKLLVEELKPFVDSRYRTRPGPESTGIGGSSMGALVSLYAALEYPRVFGRVAALSPSVWWDGLWIVRAVEALPERPPLRVWLDIGTQEGAEAVLSARRLRDAFRARGLAGDLAYHEIRNGTHDELAWGRRAGRVFAFLFPRREGAGWLQRRIAAWQDRVRW